MILCDTNILIEFYKSNDLVVQELRQIGQDQLATGQSVLQIFAGRVQSGHLLIR
jgi:predicted nucleic acid-binding protein